MVETVEYSFWLPGKRSAELFTQMSAMYNLNVIHRETGYSMAQVAARQGRNRAISLFPTQFPREVRQLMRSLLAPWPEGRYTTAYERSSSLLTVFSPSWGEQEDELWQNLLDEWKRADFTDEESRRAAFKSLEQQWNETPHPFFAGLTPAQMMVGCGPEEFELLKVFLEELTQKFDGKPFHSEGEAVVETLITLRNWQFQRRGDGRLPFDIIAAERNELLERRRRALKD